MADDDYETALDLSVKSILPLIINCKKCIDFIRNAKISLQLHRFRKKCKDFIAIA